MAKIYGRRTCPAKKDNLIFAFLPRGGGGRRERERAKSERRRARRSTRYIKGGKTVFFSSFFSVEENKKKSVINTSHLITARAFQAEIALFHVFLAPFFICFLFLPAPSLMSNTNKQKTVIRTEAEVISDEDIFIPKLEETCCVYKTLYLGSGNTHHTLLLLNIK